MIKVDLKQQGNIILNANIMIASVALANEPEFGIS
jgi:hypothetical protein